MYKQELNHVQTGLLRNPWVQKNVSEDDLKKAFRRSAMKYHPDRNPDNAEAEAKFKEAKEAYEILSDPQKRAAYDQFGHAGVDPSAGGFGGGCTLWCGSSWLWRYLRTF